MPRTKISKRQNPQQTAVNEKLEKLEALHASFVDKINADHDQFLQDILDSIYSTENRISAEVLQLTMGELECMTSCKTFEEARFELESQKKIKLTENQSILNGTNRSQTQQNSRKINQSSLVRTNSKGDEGYITDGSSTRNSVRNVQSTKQMGPLSSATAKGRVRRSRSAHTPNLLHRGYKVKRVDSSDDQMESTASTTSSSRSKEKNSTRASRSKIRIPQTPRLKTMSVDRTPVNPVTPKIQSNTPIALFRYAKQGETVISLSGSPVIANNILCDTANVNIPCANGVLSLQPTKMGAALDTTAILSNVDPHIVDQLKIIQNNLNSLMTKFNRK